MSKVLFEETKEAQQSNNMLSACTDVWCQIFGVHPDDITRHKKKDKLFILDQEFAIDVTVTLKNGANITGQEKALSNVYYKHRTFTMEFYQDRNMNKPGEFFKIASQFYLSGYSDTSGTQFIEWKMFNLGSFMMWLNTDLRRRELDRMTIGAGGSGACFLPIPYEWIPKECVVAEWCKG